MKGVKISLTILMLLNKCMKTMKMKKLILILFLFIGFPVFAANTLQQQAEKELNNLYKNNFSQFEITALLNYMLLSQDYLMKNDNKTDSMYNYVAKSISENCNSEQKENLIRCRYFKEIKNNLSFLGENQSNIKQNIINFNNKYKQIIVNDNDYQYLKGTNTIFMIWIVNSIHNFPVEKF